MSSINEINEIDLQKKLNKMTNKKEVYLAFRDDYINSSEFIESFGVWLMRVHNIDYMLLE